MQKICSRLLAASAFPLALAFALAVCACGKKEDAPPATTGAAGSTDAAKPDSAAADAAKPADGARPADPGQPSAAGTKTIVETAKGTSSLSTLVKAIEAAGLGERLSGPGPFTVFAPSDEAFAKIPAKDLEALLADKAKLETVLLYHVVPGTVSSKDLAGQKSVKTAHGGELPIDTSSGVKVGDATVVSPDVAASNGVVHVIDKVLLPPG